MRALTLASLSVRGFRNLGALDLSFGPRFNVVFGDNGQGKTNLLEAIYVLATSKSFRAGKPGEMVAHGADTASVRGAIDDGGLRREQSVGLRHGGRVVHVDGQKPKTLAAYAVLTPAVVFHPAELSMSMGSGAERRKLLDRVCLYTRPSAMASLDAYTRALKSRQKILELRGSGARDLDAWEELLVRHALEVRDARTEGCSLLAESAVRAFSKIGAPSSTLRVSYAPSGPASATELSESLRTSRERDAHRGSASVGPHRDDVALELGGHPMRGVASQGQHRAVVLSLKMAEIDVVSSVRDVRPLLLLDDVSSELDRARTEALFGFLFDRQGQVFLTTTRPELISTSLSAPGDRVDFGVRGGQIDRSGGP